MYIEIPESEIRIEFARSGGPGGQNVNKRDTKAELHWPVGPSQAMVFNGTVQTPLSQGEKSRIRSVLASRLNGDDEIYLHAQKHRTQEANRKAAVALLSMLVNTALSPPKPRVATKPGRAAAERRLEEKKRIAEKKRERRSIE